MWLATPIGFFSAVRNNQVKGAVLVRARCKADIYNLYRKFSTRYPRKHNTFRCEMTRPKSEENRDYRWRLSLRKQDWARIVATLATEIDYCNFKDEVHKHRDQDNKSSAYLSVWSALLRVQHQEDERGNPKPEQKYFDWGSKWQHDDLDLLPEQQWRSSRFDDPAPEPIKTIKSVTLDEKP